MRFPLLLALAFSATAHAQTGTWLPSASGDGVSLTSSHIVFDSDLFAGNRYTALSNATVLQARVGGAGALRFVADLPVAYAGIEDPSGTSLEDGFVLGNPYIGVEGNGGGLLLGAGVRIPILETLIENRDEGAFIAIPYGISALSDRIGAFSPETATVVGTAGVAYPLADEFTFRARLVPQFLIPIGDDSRDLEALIGYDLGLDIVAGPALLTAGARGIGIVTEDTANTSRFDHFIGVAVEVEAGGFRPGAYIEIPVSGDFQNAANAIVGIGVSTGL